MKKTTLLLLFISSISFGQNFPGQDVNLLLNKIVKPKVYDKSNQRYHYQNFFVKFDTTKYIRSYKNYAFPNSNGLYSQYEKLVGKSFKVEQIFKEHNISSSGYKKNSYVLKITNDTIGTLYYKYNAKYDFNFELTVVGGLDLPKDFYCKKIEKKEDKFTNKVSYSTPTKSGFTFYKDNDNIYMSVRERGSTANVGKTGLIILFGNGTKIEKSSAKIDVKVNRGGSGYMYSAFVELTKSDIEKLRSNLITDDRLYIYDGTVKTDDAKIIQEYVKCLTDIK